MGRQMLLDLVEHLSALGNLLLSSHLDAPKFDLAMATQSLECQTSLLLDLPAEILLLVASFLPNRDLKSLRLACKALSETAPLSFSRVFLSAHLRDIEVFRSVANHPKFRQQITEIIWDDARFVSKPVAWWGDYSPHTSPFALRMNDEAACPTWFANAYLNNLTVLSQRKSTDMDRPDHIARQQQVDAQFPPKECWEYYMEIFKEQQVVIESQEDEKAFIYGLQQFPQLKRVTVTPVAHGRTFSPLYETPTIRAFPYGFNYPIPRGWHDFPGGSSEGYISKPLAWSQAKEEYKELWRGARIVLRVLSTVDHNVSELVFDSKHFPLGLNFSIFTQQCEEQSHFKAIMKRPGFHHLHLSILAGSIQVDDPTGVTSGHFSEAVGLAKELTHMTVAFSGQDSVVSLKRLLPVQQWPKLRHLGLLNFRIDTSELIDLLGSTSPSLRSIELGSFEFLNDKRCWPRLLERMRDELDWSKLDRSLRPAVRITIEMNDRQPGRFALLTDEVTNFLYDSGENPIRERRGQPKLGVGTLYDLFELEYTRPHVDESVLKELGIVKR